MKGGETMLKSFKSFNRIAMLSAVVTAGVMSAANVFADDFSASTTDAIQNGVGAFLTPFFANLPLILSGVAAVVITLWGIRWVMSHFRGGRR